MKNLIEALNIFLKYGDVEFPTHCKRDVLYVCGYHKDKMTPEDVARLYDLSFVWDEGYEVFRSFTYGCC